MGDAIRDARVTPSAGAAAPPVVVQVVQTFGRGGLETLAVNLAVGLAQSGVRPVMVALQSGGELEATLERAGIEAHTIGGGSYRDPRTHRRIASLIDRHRPRAVHTHHFAGLASGVAAARIKRVPRVVHTEHAYQYLDERPALRRPLRWMSRYVDAFVLVGASMRGYYVDGVGVAPERVSVIVNGVDTARYREATDRAAARRALGLPAGTLIGSAGRFATVKNFPMLLDAVARVRQTRPDVRLVLAGDGADRGALEAQARALGCADAVHFLGWRSDTAEVLRCLDVFALTSWTEGLPLVILEAMACGVPVVSTSVGDIPLILESEKTGYLVPPGDTAALAETLAALVDDDVRRRRVGAAGQAFVREAYSQRTMVERYLAAYGIPAP